MQTPAFFDAVPRIVVQGPLAEALGAAASYGLICVSGSTTVLPA